MLALAASVSAYQVYQRAQAAAAAPPEQVAIDAAIDAALREVPPGKETPRAAAASPSPIAAPTSAPVSPLSLEELVRRSMPAVVRVETPEGFGSGFFIKRDTLLTNVHVVGKASTVTVRTASNVLRRATVEATAPEFDMAILRLTDGLSNDAQPILLLGSGTSARPGQDTIVLGTPLGLQNTVTRGIVSALRQVGPVTLIQTDAAVNPGNSGGPVLDRDGMVIGIATMGVKAGVGQGLSFAVAIDHATALIAGERPAAASATPLAALNEAMGGKPSSSPNDFGEADARREAGSRAFTNTIGELAKRGDELEAYWKEFTSVCYSGAIAGGFSRNWFVLFDPKAMKGVVAEGCSAQFANIRSAANQVRDQVTAAAEAARRAGVYPGTIRETLQQSRLDYSWH